MAEKERDMLEFAKKLEWLISNHDEDYPVAVEDSDDPENDRVVFVGDIRDAAAALRASSPQEGNEG